MGKEMAMARVALVCALSLASASARAQGLTVTVAPPAAFDINSTADYTLTVTNGTGAGLSDLALTAVTLPTAPAGLKVTGVSGATCKTDASGNITYPCTLAYLTSDAGPAAATAPTNQTTVTITVEWPLGNKDATGATIAPDTNVPCPAAAALGSPFSAVFGRVNDSTVTVTATDDGSKTAIDPWADLSVDLALDKASSKLSAGGTAVFDGTVTNRGPCPASSVAVTFTPSDALTFDKGEGACTDITATLGDGSTPGCSLGTNGTMAAGQVATFVHTLKIGSATGTLVSATPNYSIAVASTPVAATDVQTLDPYSDNDSATVSTDVKLNQDISGCASGGSGSLFAVAAVAGALFLVRRRRAA
jgi:uncharacterized protein (TIGR03382 family)